MMKCVLLKRLVCRGRGRWHFQQASEKAQWIICQRLNTERLGGWRRWGDQKKNAEVKLSRQASVCRISHEPLWLASASVAQAGPGRIYHSVPAPVWFTDSWLMWCCSTMLFESNNHCVGYIRAWLSTLVDVLKASMWMYLCCLSVSRCRDSTSVMLCFFVIYTAEILLLLFLINDRFYVELAIRGHC